MLNRTSSTHQSSIMRLFEPGSIIEFRHLIWVVRHYRFNSKSIIIYFIPGWCLWHFISLTIICFRSVLAIILWWNVKWWKLIQVFLLFLEYYLRHHCFLNTRFCRCQMFIQLLRFIMSFLSLCHHWLSYFFSPVLSINWLMYQFFIDLLIFFLGWYKSNIIEELLIFLINWGL